MADFGERPAQGNEQGDVAELSSQLKTLTDLMRDMQVNQAALQRQFVDLSTSRESGGVENADALDNVCLLYTSPSPRDKRQSRMPSSA